MEERGKEDKMKAFMWALLAALSWGIAPILEKIGLVKVAPISGLMVRILGVLVGGIILFCCYPAGLKEIGNYNLKAIICIVAGGIIASVVGQLFFYHALKLGEASKVVSIAAIYPLIAFILSIFVLQESVTFSKIVGIILIVSGVYCLK